MTWPLLLLALAFVPMAWEAHRSRTNERALRRAGAVEPAGDVFAAMRVIYPACFAAMIAEGWLQGRGPDAVSLAGAVVFLAGKALKYWAIATLGSRWTFRVLVPPGSGRTSSGPYGVMNHPNYVGVAGELAGMALLARAPVTGMLAVAGFGALMLARIKVEEKTLAAAQPNNRSTAQRHGGAAAQPNNGSTAQPHGGATAQPNNRSTAQPVNRATAGPLNADRRSRRTPPGV
jgi:methyltransferase